MGIEQGHILTPNQVKDLRNIDTVEVNTNKPKKVSASWLILQTLTRGIHAKDLLEEALEYSVASPDACNYQEPRLPSALHSSDHKASWLKNSELFEKKVTSGADSIFYVYNSAAEKWVGLHKLEREHGDKIPPETLALEYRRLRDLLVTPKQAKIHLAWDVSATFYNGHKHHFPEWLTVETSPLDQQLFWEYYKDSISSGLITQVSPRIDLINAVFENDSKARVGFFTHQTVQDHGSKVWDHTILRDVDIQKVATETVLTTIPHSIFLNDRLYPVFEKAQQIKNNPK